MGFWVVFWVVFPVLVWILRHRPQRHSSRFRLHKRDDQGLFRPGLFVRAFSFGPFRSDLFVRAARRLSCAATDTPECQQLTQPDPSGFERGQYQQLAVNQLRPLQHARWGGDGATASVAACARDGGWINCVRCSEREAGRFRLRKNRRRPVRAGGGWRLRRRRGCRRGRPSWPPSFYIHPSINSSRPKHFQKGFDRQYLDSIQGTRSPVA